MYKIEQKLFEIGVDFTGYSVCLPYNKFEIFTEYPPYLGGFGLQKFQKMCQEGWLKPEDAIYTIPEYNNISREG